MIIGIDASRAFVSDKTGTENYSYYLIKEMLRLPESHPHTFVLFIRPNVILPDEISGYSNVIVKVIRWKYLWTQVGLAWETWKKPVIDVLWIPAHTLPVLRNPKVKTIVTIHGLEYKWLPEYKNLLQRWYLPLSTFYAAANATKLIAVSDFTRSQLIKELHTDKKKIKVIYEGVDERAQCHSVTVQRQKYILFVGTVQPRKNLAALVEAFSIFAKQFPDYKLVIAGGIGWVAEDVLQAPGRYGVQEKVIFTGRISDSGLREFYGNAALYVQPSITEGFGLPILEAMNSGIPVISSDGGALPEVVGEGGVIVKISNHKFSNSPIGATFPVRLARAMERVISDKKLKKRLIAMGHERVKVFSWQKAALETFKVIVG